jgi:TPR repeat protein
MTGKGSLLGIVLASVALSGCAHRRNCAAISNYTAASPAALECAAAAGDKLAQLALGIRFETGDGVPRDLRRAEKLYARAARTDARPSYVYSPAVGKERYGRLIPIGPAAARPGLPEARRRFEALRRKREGR